MDQLTPAEQLFEVCITAVIEDDVTEEEMLHNLGSFVKNQKREPQEDGRLFLTVGGAFFRAIMIFSAKSKVLNHLRVELGEQAFSEMRAYARAKQMQSVHNPIDGVKAEWKKGMLGTKHELVLKQFIGRPMEIAASFINLFGLRTVYFSQRELS